MPNSLGIAREPSTWASRRLEPSPPEAGKRAVDLNDNGIMNIIDQFLIGQSLAIQKVKTLISQVANSDLNAIISGESGVGKELVAQALHLSSYRRSRPSSARWPIVI